MTTYYVCPAAMPGRFDLRQERFRVQRDKGREHPHDLMAAGFDPQGMRQIIAKWFHDTDTAALPVAE